MDPLEQSAWGGNLPSADTTTANTTDTADQSPPSNPTGPRMPSWDDYRMLMQTFMQMGNFISATDNAQRATGRALEALTSKVEAISTNEPSSTRPAPSSGLSGGTVRVREPRVFNGKAAEVEAFIDEVSNAIHLQRRSLTTDYDRSIYLAAYLEDGSPKSWYQAIRLTATHLLDDFDSLIENFRAHFGDSDLEASAYRKIASLKQTGSVANYASRFRELLVHLDWSESSKIAAFKQGLKDHVKTLLITVRQKPKEFDEFVKICVEIDNDYHQHELETKNSRHGPSKSNKSHHSDSRPPPPPPAAAPVLPQGEPMQIDATKTRRGPLTAQERERRIKNNLCVYCGGDGHKVDSCPNMSDAAKKRFADKKKANPSSGKA